MILIGLKTALLFIGIVFILFGVLSLLYSNFSAANPLLVVLGLVLASFRFLPDNRFTRIYAVLAAAAFFVMLAALAVICLKKPKLANGKQNGVVVLGCAVIGTRPSSTMRARIAAAYGYYQKYPSNTVFVLSGGKGPQEDISEAEAMKQLMLDCGVPEEQLILEDKATSTEENFIYSKKLLDEHFGSGEFYDLAFVTNDFHCYRAGVLAKKCGFCL